MIKKGCMLSIIIIFLTIFLTGCQEQTAVDTSSNKVKVDSDLVQLVQGKLNKIKDGDKVIRVEVEYRFKNIAGRIINIDTTVEFYDKNDELVATVDGIEITPMPANYEEIGTNIASYDGENVAEIAYAKLIVKEMEF